ncbi:MAG: hypothetical protein WC784_01480 [Candidatus Shapirobacteria bacterium]|jgi:predicted Na+-dependent transporter
MVPAIKLLAYSVGYTISGAGIVPTDNKDAVTKFEKFASQLIGILTLVAVLFFITQIIFAGFGFLSSEGDEKKMETNRNRLTNSVMGLFIIVIAVAIGTLIAKLLGFDNPLDITQMFNRMLFY